MKSMLRKGLRMKTYMDWEKAVMKKPRDAEKKKWCCNAERAVRRTHWTALAASLNFVTASLWGQAFIATLLFDPSMSALSLLPHYFVGRVVMLYSSALLYAFKINVLITSHFLLDFFCAAHAFGLQGIWGYFLKVFLEKVFLPLMLFTISCLEAPKYTQAKDRGGI